MSQHDVQGGVQDYVVRALRVSLLRRGDPQSMAHVGTEMLPKKVHPCVLSVDSLSCFLTSSKWLMVTHMLCQWLPACWDMLLPPVMS